MQFTRTHAALRGAGAPAGMRAQPTSFSSPWVSDRGAMGHRGGLLPWAAFGKPLIQMGAGKKQDAEAEKRRDPDPGVAAREIDDQ